VAACRFQHGLAPHDGAGSADADPDAAVDAMPDAPPDAMATCMERWLAHTPRFATPVKLASVSGSGTDRDPFLSDDELTIYFTSDRSGSGTFLYQATRPAIGSAFSSPAKVTEIDNGGDCGKFSMMQNGLYAVFASGRMGSGGGSIDVWETSRANTGAPWGAPVQTNVLAVDSVDTEQDPEISSGGLHIYLARNTSTSVQEIQIASRATVGTAFGSATRIAALYSGAGDADPALSNDLRVMVFTSGRTGAGSAGGNMWYSTRDDNTLPWGTPLPVPDVNTDSGDGDAHLGSDGCRLYFASDRGSDYDVYSATMQ
jgi:hypothetical protein